MNFLLQIRGAKKAKLWSRFDDVVMSSAERDRLLGDQGQPRPRYKKSLEDRVTLFDLLPGDGLHHPFIAPHLISTGEDISISLAVTYRTELSDIWTDAHLYNHLLRKIKLQPRPIGFDVSKDRAKANRIRAARLLKNLMKLR